MIEDATLLRAFVEQRCERSFGALVERHLGLVYQAALRQTDGDSLLAQDAAQAVFVLLARRASQLTDHRELAGWLHVTACHQARNLHRAERRRRQREQVAHAMTETDRGSAADEAWNRVRPVIDEALLELDDEDRSAVVLRFFDGRAFAEIGAALRVGENAARMRVDRALDRLQHALAKRGIVSTGAALGVALTVPAALGAPDGLASKITGTVLAGGVVGGIVGQGILYFMTTSKMLAVGAGVAAVIAMGTAVHQWNGRRGAQAEASVLREQQRELQAKVAELELRLASETGRAAKPGAKQLSAQSGDALPEEAAPLVASITSEMVDERFNKARTLARSGHHEGALREYLWCYDTGMPLFRNFAGVRASLLLEVVEMGAKFPAALAAVRARRDAIETRVLKDATDLGALLDYGPLNQALGEEDKTLVVFDMLSAGDERRNVLGRQVSDLLLEARRYGELLQVKPYRSMVSGFDLLRRRGSGGGYNRADPGGRVRDYAIKTAVKDVEALAGADEVANARDFIAKILAFDASPETRTLLAGHLARAGHPELLAP